MTDSKIKSALDAAGTAADYSARATYQRGYDAGVASVASETSNRHTGDSMTDWSDDKITALMGNEADRCASRIVNALDRGSLPTGNSDVESAIKRAIHRVEDRAIAAEARESETMRGLDAGREVLRDMWSALNAVRAAGPMPYGYSYDHVSAVVETGKKLLGDDARPWMTDAARLLVAPYQQRVVDEQARADAAEARAEVAIARACEAVEAREWALGVQVVAQAARLRLADDVVSAARALVSRAVGLGPCLADYVAVHHALAAYDAVPGDDKETT